ncbi:methionyl-tRNA formyltransferase [Polluticoccus soli]|uniref:methionyl-tRNA formyltransferase n=1 Tax=Polluticoccus soli TaxID=3034150 RepID=UPI0023E2C7B0|nr:methionyl-tRNA formyltransferase [Flavipsychrobacter sp. JY13-12]
MPSLSDLRIVFYGTPDFAVASLDALVQARANVVAVVTAPDKPAGRGMQLNASAVKQYALEKGLSVLQPVKLKDPEFIAQLQSLKADLQVVVAFRMMPEGVWNMPPMGTINVHASLLPQYRGAAPINWAIINGETETGVTTFKLKHEIDTGDILLQKSTPIEPADNIGTLYERLMKMGGELLVETVKGLAEGTINEIPQQSVASSALKHAPKIFKETTLIDWDKPVLDIHNLVRGLSPYPVAYTMHNGKFLKIYISHAEAATHGKEPGTLDTDAKTYLRFAAKDGWLYLDELQQEGKKRMDVTSFLRGFRG